MNTLRQVGVALVVAVAVAGSWNLLATAQQRGTAGNPVTPLGLYSVVETQGHNLLVTNNMTNKLYFYTVDKDKPVGSPLKLRASIDLSQVGKPEINVNEHAVERVK